MKCPKCGSDNVSVNDSRNSPRRNGWKRKRLCNKCGQVFKTVERYSLTIEEISDVRINLKEQRRRENIARIKEQAARLHIKLAED